MLSVPGTVVMLPSGAVAISENSYIPLSSSSQLSPRSGVNQSFKLIAPLVSSTAKITASGPVTLNTVPKGTGSGSGAGGSGRTTTSGVSQTCVPSGLTVKLLGVFVTLPSGAIAVTVNS